jgi:hypothetical protein
MNAKKYVLTLLIGVPLVIGIIGFLVMSSIVASDFSTQYIELVRYQKNKLNNVKRLDIAFVGDSSLGNAIDSQTWSLNSNKKTISLALTGAFGFGGSYGFAKQAIERGAKTILVMQTLDIFDKSRALSQDHRGYLYTVQSYYDILVNPVNISTLIEFIYDKAHIKIAMQKNFSRIYSYFLENIEEKSITNRLQKIKKHDYWPQGDKKDYSASRGYLDYTKINRDKIFYLRKLNELCKTKKINCIYMHGPINENYCKKSKQYISSVNKLVRSTGIKLLSDMPYCIDNKRTGDSKDHVLPVYKDELTRYFLEKINKFTAL